MCQLRDAQSYLTLLINPPSRLLNCTKQWMPCIVYTLKSFLSLSYISTFQAGNSLDPRQPPYIGGCASKPSNELPLHGMARMKEVHWCRGRAAAADVLFVPLLLLLLLLLWHRRVEVWWVTDRREEERGFVLFLPISCLVTDKNTNICHVKVMRWSLSQIHKGLPWSCLWE